MDATAATTWPHVRLGRLRALAVPTAQRAEVPAIAGSGVPGFDVVNWYGPAAPQATSAPVIATLHAAVLRQFAAQGLEPRPCSTAEFGAFLRAEAVRWARVVKAAGIASE